MKKKQKHVLITEDNAFLAKMMQRILIARGIRVSTAQNGKDTIAIMEKDPPDLLLLDLLLPQMDGFAVLRYRMEKKLSFPVIVCSNLSDKATKTRCKAFHIDEYVVKSDMDDQQLWPVVEKHLK